MKAISRIGLAFLIVLSLNPGSGLGESGVTIKGNITPQEDYELVDAYLQLVPLAPGDKLEVSEARRLIDISGRVLGIEYASESPKLEMQEEGVFVYKVESLKPGRYIIGVQHLIPMSKPTGYFGPGPWLSRPLAKENGKQIVIEISKEDKPPFTIDLGQVIVPIDERTKFITIEFKDVVLVKP